MRDKPTSYYAAAAEAKRRRLFARCFGISSGPSEAPCLATSPPGCICTTRSDETVHTGNTTPAGSPAPANPVPGPRSCHTSRCVLRGAAPALAGRGAAARSRRRLGAAGPATRTRRAAARLTDAAPAGECYAMPPPRLIDLQVNGYAGVDFNDADLTATQPPGVAAATIVPHHR